MMVVGNSNGGSGLLWGGGPSRAAGEAPVSDFPVDPPQRSELYHGGSSVPPTRTLRSNATAPMLPSIADVLRGAAAGQDSLLRSAMAAGIFAPQPPMLPAIASVSSDTSSPSLDFPPALHPKPAHSIAADATRSSTDRGQGGGSRVQAAVAKPLASARPLQALAFEEFLREKHQEGVNPQTPHPLPQHPNPSTRSPPSPTPPTPTPETEGRRQRLP